LHEIIHAVIFLSSLNSDGGVLKDDDAEEQVANTITNWLMGVFRDNPAILDTLKETIYEMDK